MKIGDIINRENCSDLYTNLYHIWSKYYHELYMTGGNDNMYGTLDDRVIGTDKLFLERTGVFVNREQGPHLPRMVANDIDKLLRWRMNHNQSDIPKGES